MWEKTRRYTIFNNKKYCEYCHILISTPPTPPELVKPEPVQKQNQIKCPYCEHMFKPITRIPYGRKTSDNILKGIIFLPWGVSSALKAKQYVQCPHCKMKIMQG